MIAAHTISRLASPILEKVSPGEIDFPEEELQYSQPVSYRSMIVIGFGEASTTTILTVEIVRIELFFSKKSYQTVKKNFHSDLNNFCCYKTSNNLWPLLEAT